MKWYLFLSLTSRKAADQDDITDPPVVLNMKPKAGFVDTNYEHHLNEVMETLLWRTTSLITIIFLKTTKNPKNFHMKKYIKKC